MNLNSPPVPVKRNRVLSIGIATVVLPVLFWSHSATAQMFGGSQPNLELFNAGKKHYKAKDYKAAFDKLSAFIKKHPYEYQTREAVFLMGQAKRLSGDCFEAVRYYKRLRSRYAHAKERADSLFFEAVCYRKVGLSAKALVTFKEYLDKYKTGKRRLSVYYQLGEVYYKQKKATPAAKYFNKVRRILESYNLKEPKVRKLLIRTYYRLGSINAKSYHNVPLAYRYLKPLLGLENFKHSDDVKFLLRDISFFHLDSRSGLPDNTVSSVKFDGDDIWIGTWLGGLTRFTRSTGKLKVYSQKDGLVSNAVRDVLVDFDEVWVSTYDGVGLYSKNTGKFKKKTGIATQVQDSFKDGRYIYFASLSKGVTVYDRIKKTSQVWGKSSALKTNQVQRIRGGAGVIVFCTLNHGAVLYRPKGNSFTRLTKANGLPGNSIGDALVDGRYIWLAVHGKGVVRYDQKTKKLKHFKPDPKTIHPIVSSLQRRGFEIWMATLGGGVRIFNKETEKWRKLTVIDGLPTNEIRAVEFEGDYVWLPTLDRGVTIYYDPPGQKDWPDIFKTN